MKKNRMLDHPLKALLLVCLLVCLALLTAQLRRCEHDAIADRVIEKLKESGR